MKTLRIFGYIVILALIAIAIQGMASYWLDVAVFNFSSTVFTVVLHLGILLALFAALFHYHKATK